MCHMKHKGVTHFTVLTEKEGNETKERKKGEG
jgi:hypothetical protein